MAWVAVGTAVVTAVGGLAQANAAKKAAQGAKAKPVDVDKLITDARTSAAENYKNSLALEAQYNPEQAALRGNALLRLNDLANGNVRSVAARDNLLNGVVDEANPLLESSAASILKSLALEGSLSPETQNLITRSALQTGARAGISGSDAARGLVARDLGLTSLSLQQARQQAALQAGQAMSADSLNRLNAAQNAANADTALITSVGALAAANPLPESGLSPADIAGVTIGNNNTMNQSNANYYAAKGAADAQRINSLLGFTTSMMGAYGGGKFSSKSSSTGPVGGWGSVTTGNVA
jgi:hypothetical protein